MKRKGRSAWFHGPASFSEKLTLLCRNPFAASHEAVVATGEATNGRGDCERVERFNMPERPSWEYAADTWKVQIDATETVGAVGFLVVYDVADNRDVRNIGILRIKSPVGRPAQRFHGVLMSEVQ